MRKLRDVWGEDCPIQIANNCVGSIWEEGTSNL